VVGDGLGIGVLVMCRAGGRCVFFLQQRGAQLVTDADGLSDVPLQVEFTLDESRTQFIHAGMVEVSDRGRVLDQQSHLGIRAQVELIAVPQFQTQRHLQALQCRWKLRMHG